MTVSHLQSVKKSDEQKFMEGFEVKGLTNNCNLRPFYAIITGILHQHHESFFMMMIANGKVKKIPDHLPTSNTL
jgi:hypothetical protein